MKHYYKFIIFFLIFSLSIALGYLFTNHTSHAESVDTLNKACIKCHSIKRLPKVLPDGEKMSLYVNIKRFKKSVHGNMDCIYCHRDINIYHHPYPVKFKTKREFVKRVTKYCLVCHPLSTLSPFHRRIVKAGKVTCDVCHTAHYIKSMKEIRAQTKECIKCHSIKRLPKVLPDGEKMSLYVNPKKFAHTNHAKLGCFACHYDIYNSPRHPYPMKIKSKKEFTKKIVARCMECHTYASLCKYKGHKYIVKKHISCIKCHGYHVNTPFKVWKKKVSINDYCLTCHRLAITEKLPDGEVISLKVDPNILAHSVHRGFKCTDCHRDFSKDKHPIYHWKSKEEFTKHLSRMICEYCHTDAKLKKNPAHYLLAKKEACVKCHGYHNVKSIKAVTELPINQYCLVCHRDNIVKKMKDGEVLSVKVNEEVLLHSVHKNLKCTDCHTGFSKTTHPYREYASIKAYRREAINICAKCHSKEVALYEKGVHGTLYLKGNSKAPSCLTCHGYHDVKKITTSKEKLALCVKCHSKAFATFKDSVHYEAMLKGNKNAPTCSDCHGAHGIKEGIAANLTNNCLKCHKDVMIVHNKWLYNPPFTLVSFVKAHFNGASCAVCHAKGDKAVAIALLKEGKALSVKEVAKILGISVEDVKTVIDSNGDGKVSGKELWNFVHGLCKKGERGLKVKGRLVMLNLYDAHRIQSKSFATKKCSECHNPSANFKGELELANGAKVFKLTLTKHALNSVYAIPTIRHFYVLALTKISVLDLLFLLAAICGLGFAMGHIFLRIVTTPIRRKRRQEGK
ncbi:MAG: cytochrome c family protein [Thermodesulfobacteria bacterium]|nr:cytochrome c family protein [Thermodesulfobacteriota bacterium]